MDPIQDELLSTMVASPIYRGPGPLPNVRREGIPQRPSLKGGQLVQAILTKGGLRLPKALVVTLLWAPW